jgi:predicted HTH transcriptional regulator
MDISELKDLIRCGENEKVDFKKSITNLYKIARTMVAFANQKGGQMLVGVDDQKQIIGVQAEEEKYMLSQAADLYVAPPIHIIFEEIEIEKNVVLVVNIPEGKEKSYLARNEQDEWKMYIRQHDKSILVIP